MQKSRRCAPQAYRSMRLATRSAAFSSCDPSMAREAAPTSSDGLPTASVRTAPSATPLKISRCAARCFQTTPPAARTYPPAAARPLRSAPCHLAWPDRGKHRSPSRKVPHPAENSRHGRHPLPHPLLAHRLVFRHQRLDRGLAHGRRVLVDHRLDLGAQHYVTSPDRSARTNLASDARAASPPAAGPATAAGSGMESGLNTFRGAHHGTTRAISPRNISQPIFLPPPAHCASANRTRQRS